MTLICCMNVFRLSQLSGRKCSLKPGRCWQSHGKHRKASVRDFRSWVVESYLVLSRSKSYCHDLSRWIGWMVLCHAATRCPKMVIVVRMLKEGRGPYWNIIDSWQCLHLHSQAIRRRLRPWLWSKTTSLRRLWVRQCPDPEAFLCSEVLL